VSKSPMTVLLDELGMKFEGFDDWRATSIWSRNVIFCMKLL
jgi:hypothetical protein